MQIIDSISTMVAQSCAWRQQQQTVAFVPTMGNLHQGHLSLVERAAQQAEQVVVSIFVNPLQFGPNEDFATYPRTLKQDCKALESFGVAAVFTPTTEQMYPLGKAQQTQVFVPGLSNLLCGEYRPGFFQGVATVVTKLFNIIQPDVAVFGEKDYQQLLIIKHLVADLNLPIKIIAAPIQREASGLALSSRNRYLSEQQKADAAVIQQSLQQASQQIKQGQRDYSALEQTVRAQINQKGLDTQYISIRNAHDLSIADAKSTRVVLLAAAFAGSTRLIDNLQVTVPSAPSE